MIGEQVGLCNVLFEDYLAFTHITACTLAGSPKVTRYLRGFSHFVTSMTAPIASGWSKITVEICEQGNGPSCLKKQEGPPMCGLFSFQPMCLS